MHYKIHKLTHPLALSPKERILVEELRDAIRSLPNISREKPEVSTAENTWIHFRESLRNEILTSDPRYFLHWSVIMHTMFYPGDKVELAALQKSEQWQLWEAGIKETSVGYPARHEDYPLSSGNLIHHAYLLHRLSKTLDINPRDLQSVFEFGGGYGSTARLLYQLGFRGEYIIFDLPEFLLLQKFFLRSLCEEKNIDWNSSTLSKIQFLSETESIPERISPDLFIAAWSLSESPIAVREKLLPPLKASKYIAIAYQHKFREIDSIAYFKKISEQMPGYTWISEDILHQPGNSFLFGRRGK